MFKGYIGIYMTFTNVSVEVKEKIKNILEMRDDISHYKISKSNIDKDGTDVNIFIDKRQAYEKIETELNNLLISVLDEDSESIFFNARDVKEY